MAFSFFASNVYNDELPGTDAVRNPGAAGLRTRRRPAHEPPPGQFPFTRGNFATGYRGRRWTFRQYSGFGTAEESNRRYRYLLDQGGTGLSVALDLPTQQILAYETGIARVADPLGGSYFVESLTDATEAGIKEIMDDLDRHGGMVRAIEDGYLQGLIADEAFRDHQRTEDGTKPVVGVNRFTSDEGAADLATYELDPGGRDRQPKRLAQVKHDRDQVTVQATLTKLKAAAEGTENLMGPLIDCANACCTVGEMVATLKDVWGEFQQPVVF